MVAPGFAPRGFFFKINLVRITLRITFVLQNTANMKKVNHPKSIAELVELDNVATLDFGIGAADYAQKFFKQNFGNATGLQVNRLFKEESVIIWVAYCTGNESDCLYMAQY